MNERKSESIKPSNSQKKYWTWKSLKWSVHFIALNYIKDKELLNVECSSTTFKFQKDWL